MRATFSALAAGLLLAASGNADPPSAAPVSGDVFVILVDALRYDAMRPFQESSPFGSSLEHLAQDGVLLKHLRAPSSWTRTSVATLLTGLSPLQHRVLNRTDVLAPYLPNLARRLHDRGYRTRAWSTNPNILPEFGFGEGFDSFTSVRPLEWGSHKATAAEVFAAVGNALSQDTSSEVFYYIHLMDPHSPYRPPPEQVEKLGGNASVPGLFPGRGANSAAAFYKDFRNYLGEVGEVDQELGRFLERLESAGRYEPAVILVVSDHGEEFGDHGGRWHGRTLYEEMLRVPGVLKLPGNVDAGRIVSRAVAYTELAPAIERATALGPREGREAEPILEESEPESFAATLVLDEHRKSAIYEDGWKLIIDRRTGAAELFDLSTDPHEEADVATTHPSRVRELGEQLERENVRNGAGWHLRGCGCELDASLEFILEAQGWSPRFLRPEPTDTARKESSEGWRVRLSLDPRPGHRERGKNLEEVQVPDEDDIWLQASGESPGPITIRPVGPDPFLMAVGEGPIESTRDPVILEDDARTRIGAGKRIDCQTLENDTPPGAAASSCAPHLRAWYVPPAEEADPGTIGPDLREQLRSLGYEW